VPQPVVAKPALEPVSIWTLFEDWKAGSESDLRGTSEWMSNGRTRSRFGSVASHDGSFRW